MTIVCGVLLLSGYASDVLTAYATKKRHVLRIGGSRFCKIELKLKMVIDTNNLFNINKISIRN